VLYLAGGVLFGIAVLRARILSPWAVVGTSVSLYPVAKRYNESIALGYVGLRTREAAVITVGIGSRVPSG
jgi:hypothetical protein